MFQTVLLHLLMVSQAHLLSIDLGLFVPVVNEEKNTARGNFFLQYVSKALIWTSRLRRVEDGDYEVRFVFRDASGNTASK